MATVQKTNSLTELGFTIEQINNVVTDENGNRWMYKLIGKAPTFYIKQTKSGKMLAYRSKTDKLDTTINGLYNFKEQNGDLIGERSSVVVQKQPAQAKKKAPKREEVAA